MVDTETNGTDITFVYDEDSLVTSRTDEAGNVLTYTYDGNHRRKKVEVTTQASGFIGTEEMTFKYDGLGRRTESFDDNNGTSSDSDDITCTWVYDSLSRLVEENQKIGSGSPRAVTCNFDAGEGSIRRESSCIYPDEREVENTYDALDRLLTRRDNGQSSDIGKYEYLGRGRVAVLTYQNDTRLTYIDQDSGQNADVGYDTLGRPIVHRWESFDTDDLGEGDLIVGFEHRDGSGNSLYDRVHNKKIEYKTHDEVNSEMYTYDSAYRLTDPSSSTQNGFRRGEFEDGDRDSMATEDVNYYQDWQLDGLGNWQSVWKNSATAQTRTHSDFNEIVNNNGTTLTYDTNGNLTDDGTVTVEYDALNRVKEVKRKSNSETLATYLYDASNRRMQKVVQNGGLPDDETLDGTTRFYYHGWRVLEERDGSGDIQRQFTYGNYLDEVWTIDDRDGVTVANLNDSSSGTAADRHFAHSNTLYHVYGITDEDGDLVEGYQYDAYGNATVFTDGNSNGIVDFDGTDNTANWSCVNNPYQYTSQRYDPETGWLYYKNRYYDTDLGRFISRDPLKYADGLNLYEYVGNNPLLRLVVCQDCICG